MSLPCRLGGLSIPIPTNISDHQFSASKQISVPLASLIIQQSREFSIPSLQSIKCNIRRTKQQLLNTQFHNIKSRTDPLLQRTIDMLSAKCSSLWLTALPIREQGFHLNKQEFQDALRLRYEWELSRGPSHSMCGATFSANHAMICCLGRLTFIRHNELQDLTASWLHEVCHDMAAEPPL